MQHATVSSSATAETQMLNFLDFVSVIISPSTPSMRKFVKYINLTNRIITQHRQIFNYNIFGSGYAQQESYSGKRFLQAHRKRVAKFCLTTRSIFVLCKT